MAGNLGLTEQAATIQQGSTAAAADAFFATLGADSPANTLSATLNAPLGV